MKEELQKDLKNLEMKLNNKIYKFIIIYIEFIYFYKILLFLI